MFMKLKYTTRHLNFYFLKIHILRLLFCVYIVGMAGFVLASRRNDGQKTKDGSGNFTGKKEEKRSLKTLSGKSSNYYIFQEENPSNNKEATLNRQEELLEASQLTNKASRRNVNSNVQIAVRNLRSVNAKASVDLPDTNGWTSLMFSAKRGSEPDIDCLAKARAKVNTVNNKGVTSTMIAVVENKLKAVKALLRLHADITITDRNGATALTHAQSVTPSTTKQGNKSKRGNKSIQREQKTNQEIKDQLHTRTAYNQVKAGFSKKTANHIGENHYGNGQQIISVDGMESIKTNSGDIKTAFPSKWPEEKIFTAVTSILYNPETLERNLNHDHVRLLAEGKFEELPIKVVMEVKNNSKINVITAFPIKNK